MDGWRRRGADVVAMVDDTSRNPGSRQRDARRPRQMLGGGIMVLLVGLTMSPTALADHACYDGQAPSLSSRTHPIASGIVLYGSRIMEVHAEVDAQACRTIDIWFAVVDADDLGDPVWGVHETFPVAADRTYDWYVDLDSWDVVFGEYALVSKVRSGGGPWGQEAVRTFGADRVEPEFEGRPASQIISPRGAIEAQYHDRDQGHDPNESRTRVDPALVRLVVDGIDVIEQDRQTCAGLLDGDAGALWSVLYTHYKTRTEGGHVDAGDIRIRYQLQEPTRSLLKGLLPEYLPVSPSPETIPPLPPLVHEQVVTLLCSRTVVTHHDLHYEPVVPWTRGVHSAEVHAVDDAAGAGNVGRQQFTFEVD